MKTRGGTGKKPVPASADGMKLCRYLARAGVASRRRCEEEVSQGMITVNGILVTNPAARISAGDTVLRDGSAVVVPDLFAAVMNKPVGYETTMSPDASRPVSILSSGMPRGVSPVGRLDVRTGGLLLWSNDGELVYRLSHPRWKVEREYTLLSAVPLTREVISRLARGAFIEPGAFSKPLSVKRTGERSLSLVLTTGRNREVRRLSAICGLKLSGLERVRYGPVNLTGLERGSWRQLTDQEAAALCGLVRLKR